MASFMLLLSSSEVFSSIRCSNKGYMNKVISHEWIEHDFDATTKADSGGHTRLLVVDGHSSHFTYELLEYAKSANIIVVCLPPHTTHVLQSVYKAASRAPIADSTSSQSLRCSWVLSVQAQIPQSSRRANSFLHGPYHKSRPP